MKIKLFGDWFGLSFGAFLLVAAIMAIPMGKGIGDLLLLWGNSTAPAQVLAQADIPVQAALPATAPRPASESQTQASTSSAMTTTTSIPSPAPTPAPKVAAVDTQPAALKSAVATSANAATLQSTRLDNTVNSSNISAPVAQAPQSPSAGATWLQVAAVMREDSARTLANTLMKKGYPVQVKEPHRDTLYRVQVGPYPNRQGAQMAAQSLKADGFQVIVIG